MWLLMNLCMHWEEGGWSSAELRVNLLWFHKSVYLEASGRIIHLSPVGGQGPRLTCSPLCLKNLPQSLALRGDPGSIEKASFCWWESGKMKNLLTEWRPCSGSPLASIRAEWGHMSQGGPPTTVHTSRDQITSDTICQWLS